MGCLLLVGAERVCGFCFGFGLGWCWLVAWAGWVVGLDWVGSLVCFDLILVLVGCLGWICGFYGGFAVVFALFVVLSFVLLIITLFIIDLMFCVCRFNYVGLDYLALCLCGVFAFASWLLGWTLL